MQFNRLQTTITTTTTVRIIREKKNYNRLFLPSSSTNFYFNLYSYVCSNVADCILNEYLTLKTFDKKLKKKKKLCQHLYIFLNIRVGIKIIFFTGYQTILHSNVIIMFCN